MRILFYASSLSRSAGGLYYSVSGLAKALAQAGHTVSVAGGTDAHFAEDRAIWGDLPLMTHPARPGGYGFDPGILRRMLSFRPDILHIHGIWSAASVYGLAGALRGARVVVSPRGMLDPWILRRKRAVKAVHGALIERPLLARAALHALNRSEAQSAAAFMPSLASRTFVVPNGVPAAEIAVPDRGKTGAVFLGRLHPKKQVLELVRAWQDSGLPDVRLTVAGWGDPDYEARVKALCDGDRVVFAGPCYGDAKSALLAGARWFLLPSLSEGLPMAALEALQHGCIPILTPECNLPELAEHGVAFEMRRDFGDFPALMVRLAGLGTDELDALSERCRGEARNYAWEAIADQMIRHYEMTLRDRQTRSAPARTEERNAD